MKKRIKITPARIQAIELKSWQIPPDFRDMADYGCIMVFVSGKGSTRTAKLKLITEYINKVDEVFKPL
jgi:hypothetical protein